MRSIVDDLNSTFGSKLFHMGGDETNDNCWDSKPSIKEWMTEHGMEDYFALQSYYR